VGAGKKFHELILSGFSNKKSFWICFGHSGVSRGPVNIPERVPTRASMIFLEGYYIGDYCIVDHLSGTIRCAPSFSGWCPIR
jgi:hypothetical protein